MALLAALLLAACGPRPTDVGSGATPTGVASAPPAPPGEVLEIGACLPLTGHAASFGEGARTGMELAVERINASGGVLGRKLHLLAEDTQGRPDQAAQAARKLVEGEGVLCILGEVSSANSLAVASVCQEAQVPMISPSSTLPGVTQVGTSIFRVCFTDEFQGEALARFAAGDLERTRAALLVDSSSDYSRGVAEAFKRAFATSGGSIVAEESYSQGDADFANALGKLATADPDVLVVPGYYKEAASIAAQAKQQGLDVPLLGGDGWDSPELLGLGGEGLEGSYFATHYDPQAKDPQVAEFVAAFRERAGGPPDFVAALGYDAVGVLADALRRGGRPDRQALRDALAATRDYPGVTGNITLQPDRDADKAAVVLQVRDGERVQVARLAPEPRSSPGSAP